MKQGDYLIGQAPLYAPMQLVAPSAVTMAVATDAMICTINFNVSFLLIAFDF